MSGQRFRALAATSDNKIEHEDGRSKVM